MSNYTIVFYLMYSVTGSIFWYSKVELSIAYQLYYIVLALCLIPSSYMVSNFLWNISDALQMGILSIVEENQEICRTKCFQKVRIYNRK